MEDKELEKVVATYFGSIDKVVIDYVQSYFTDKEILKYIKAQGPDELLFEIGPLLLDASEDPEKDQALENFSIRVKQFCDKHKITSSYTDSFSHEPKPLSLDNPVNLSELNSSSAIASAAMQYLQPHTFQQTYKSQVDTTKLAKAKLKLKKKQEKRLLEDSAMFNKLALKEELLLQREREDRAAQLLCGMDPLELYKQAKGKVKDIRVENFDVSIGGRSILRSANLQLAFGRRYGLIGRNGVGKSTLLRAIAFRDINVPLHISVLYVEQEIHGDETPALKAVLEADELREFLLKREKELSSKKTDIDGENAVKLKEVYQYLEEIESDKAEATASGILHGLGFSREQQMWPTKKFSGGWRMRIALARALFRKPDLLLLDEPTNMLDFNAVVWLETYLANWPSTLLVVSHDRQFLDHVTTDIIHQHEELLDLYRGDYMTYLKTKHEKFKQLVREYESQVQYRAHLQAFIDRWRYNANRAAQAQSKIKILEKLPVLVKPVEEPPVEFKFPENDVSSISPPILQMDNISFRYSPNDPFLFHKVNLDCQLDSRIAIVGPNGAGKTTLLKLLIGILSPTSGIVKMNAKVRVSFFSQHHVDQLDMRLTPISFLGSLFPGLGEEEYRSQLSRFGVTAQIATRPISTLSGGQKSRVVFARIAMENPRILVLDEPTNHLDMDTIDALVKALQEFPGGVIMVSHDEQFIMSTCNEIWVCDGLGGNHQDGEVESGVRRVESLVAYKEGILSSMNDKQTN